MLAAALLPVMSSVATAASAPTPKPAPAPTSNSQGSNGRHAGQGPTRPEQGTVHKVCGTPRHGFASCHAEQLYVVGTGGSGYGPLDLQDAYNLPSDQGAGTTVGIVDAYDDPNVEADLAKYRSFYSLPPCTTANGCFTKLAQDGTHNYPGANASWTTEISIDVDMVSAICPYCHITLIEANSNSNTDLATAENEAVAVGSNVVSNSWGSAEFSSETTYDSAFNHPGVAIVASSGDSGFPNQEWPAANRNVIAAGGTTLLVAPTPRGWRESAWSGSGSGCSPYELKPSWQTDSGCSTRTVADVSADGDPNTPVWSYDSFQSGGWGLYGGTSVSAPIIAGVEGLTGSNVWAAGPGAFYQTAYPFPGSVYDITSGSSGSCGGSYLCTAGHGYDAPTGLGTPDGVPPAALVSAPPPSSYYGGSNPGTSWPNPCANGDPVQCTTGNLTETVTDLAVAGRGPALNLSRSYNSLDAATASSPEALGWGWADGYAMSASVDGSGNVTIHQGNGSTVTFSPSSGAYTQAPWVTARLVKNADGTYTYTLADQTTYKFSSAGALMSITDREGYATTLGYNASGQLTTVADAAGRNMAFSYNTSGQLASVRDPLGRTVSYSYDSAGNLTAVTDPAGSVTRYGYDSAHRLTTLTRPDGGVTTNVYDTSNRVTSQTDPLGHNYTFAYTPGQTTITDPNGNVNVENYTNLQLTSVTAGAGTASAATTSFGYSQGLEKTVVVDPDGHVSHFIYDSKGDLVTLVDGLGRVTSYTYDAANDLTSITDPLGYTTTYTYDSHGNRISATTTLASTGQTVTTTGTYGDPAHPGDVTAWTDPDGHVSTYSYDSYGNRTATTDPAADTALACFNIIGEQTAAISARGAAAGVTCGTPAPASYTTYTAYDADGRPTTVTDPLGHATKNAYDADGNKISVTDPDGNITKYQYNLAGEMTATIQADNTTLTNTYDADGNNVTATNAAGKTTIYAYQNPAHPSAVTSTTDPLGHTTTYGYDPDGNRTTATDPSGRATTYTYDAAKQLTATTYSQAGTANATYVYDADGRRTRMTDGTGTTTYGYDSLGRLTSTQNGAGLSVLYNHDLAGNTTAIGYPYSNTGSRLYVTRTYDSANRITAISDWIGNTTRFGYNADGSLTGEQLPNGITNTVSVDQAGQTATITDTNSRGLTVGSFAYTRDANGLITADNDTGVPAPAAQKYSYDSLIRLASDSVGSYGYDQANDLTSKPSGTTQTFNADSQITSSTPAGAGSVTTAYTYDAQGNRTSAVNPIAGTTTLTYDQANRLTGYGSTATYSYSGDGVRVSKTASGITTGYTWDLATQTPELLSDGTNNYVYGPDGLPLEQFPTSATPTSGSSSFYYLHDQIGSTRLIVDNSGTIDQTSTYSPYGQLLGSSTVQGLLLTNPFGFAGAITDPESGFLYLTARYYDPSTAQFLTVDPAVNQTRSPYGYAGDSPLNLADPTGLTPSLPCVCDTMWNGVLGSVAGGAISSLESLLPTPGNIENDLCHIDPWCDDGFDNAMKFVNFAAQYPSWPSIGEATGAMWLWATGKLGGGWWKQMDSYLANHLGQGALWGVYKNSSTATNWANAHNNDLFAAWNSFGGGFFKLSSSDQQVALGFMCGALGINGQDGPVGFRMM